MNVFSRLAYALFGGDIELEEAQVAEHENAMNEINEAAASFESAAVEALNRGDGRLAATVLDTALAPTVTPL